MLIKKVAAVIEYDDLGVGNLVSQTPEAFNRSKLISASMYEQYRLCHFVQKIVIAVFVDRRADRDKACDAFVVPADFESGTRAE